MITIQFFELKKKFIQIILVSVFVLDVIQSSGQVQPLLAHTSYSVDKQIDLQISKFGWVDTGTLKNSMSIKVLTDSKVFLNGTMFNQTLDCYTTSYLKGDTINITGFMIGQLGWGFELVLHKDSCIAASFALSDGKIYKYKKSDTDSIDLILLPNISQKVVLSKKPAFRAGEIVSGAIELKSIPYYYTNDDGKCTINLKAYFKTAALKKMQ